MSMVVSTVLVASSAFPFDGKSSAFSGTEWLEFDNAAVDQVMTVRVSRSS